MNVYTLYFYIVPRTFCAISCLKICCEDSVNSFVLSTSTQYLVPRTMYIGTLLLLCLLCAPPRPPRRIRTARAHIAQFHCVVSIIVFCINQCGLPPLLFCHSRSYEQSTARARTLSYLVLSTQKRSLHYHTRFHAYILCTSYL